MFAASKTDSVSAVAPDDKFNYVTMLLHGDGTNGAQNNTFLDSSTNNFSITRNGNTTQGSFSPYGSGWSIYFNGSSRLDYPSSANLALGSGNWTVQFWANFTLEPTDNQTAVELFSMRLIIGRKTNKKVRVHLNGAKDGANSGPTLENGQWNYIVIARTGTTVNVYVNSTAVYSFTDSTNFSTSTIATVGRNSDAAEPMTGYVSNVRILKGTYDISVPTAPYTAITNTQLLTCQSNRLLDNSANNFTVSPSGDLSVQRFNPFGTSTAYSTSVIGGSGYFDGSGDYLSIATNAALQFGTGNFTFECWIYPNGVAGNEFIADFGATSASGWGLYDEGAGGNMQFRIADTDRIAVNPLIAGVWSHVAIVRSGTTATLYVNGTSVGSYGSAGTNLTYSGTNYIGSQSGSSNYMNGYMSNIRAVKGTAVYTANFTPPTEPLTAISGTSLLLNYTNSAIFDNAMMNDLETVGNVQISTSVKKFGTGSLAFDGSGDYLAGPYNPNVDFGTGDFTVEFWFYFNGSVTAAGFVGSKNTGGMDFSFTSSSLRIGRINTAWDSIFSWSPSANTWYHIAYTRSSGVARAFVNGTQVDANSSNTNNYYPNGGIYVGVAAPPDRYVNGYIDDLRITKGYARYTSNFTAPIAAFSDKGPY